MKNEERVYVECTTCCWGVSSPDLQRLYDKEDEHLRENPGHKVKYTDLEDDD